MFHTARVGTICLSKQVVVGHYKKEQHTHTHAHSQSTRTQVLGYEDRSMLLVSCTSQACPWWCSSGRNLDQVRSSTVQHAAQQKVFWAYDGPCKCCSAVCVTTGAALTWLAGRVAAGGDSSSVKFHLLHTQTHTQRVRSKSTAHYIASQHHVNCSYHIHITQKL